MQTNKCSVCQNAIPLSLYADVRARCLCFAIYTYNMNIAKFIANNCNYISHKLMQTMNAHQNSTDMILSDVNAFPIGIIHRLLWRCSRESKRHGSFCLTCSGSENFGAMDKIVAVQLFYFLMGEMFWIMQLSFFPSPSYWW